MKTQILLVEDDRSIGDMAANHLGKEGFESVCAYDGEQALYLSSANRTILVKSL